MSKIIRLVAIAGVWVALTVGLSYLFAFVPNVEVILLMCFLGGRHLGIKWGVMVAFLSMLIFSVFNPFGMPILPALLAQLVGVVISAIVGSFSRRIASEGHMIVWAGLGLALTLLYDIITNLSVYFVFGSPETIWAFVIGGLIFAVVHEVSNTLIFGLVGPLISKRLSERIQVLT
jgi:hypothetical protein